MRWHSGVAIYSHLSGRISWICQIYVVVMFHNSSEVLSFLQPQQKIQQKIHPRKLTCPLKRDYFNRKHIFQPLIFSKHVSFPGSNFSIQVIYRTHLRTCGASSFRESAPWPLRHFFLGILPETNSSHLKMDGWNTIVPFCVSAHFQGGTASSREWTPPKTNMTMENPPFENGDFPLSCKFSGV